MLVVTARLGIGLELGLVRGLDRARDLVLDPVPLSSHGLVLDPVIDPGFLLGPGLDLGLDRDPAHLSARLLHHRLYRIPIRYSR